MNSSTYIGNLTREPTFGGQGETQFCKFGLAVPDIFSKDGSVDFFEVTVFGKAVSQCASRAHKGVKVAIQDGSTHPRNFKQNGKECHSVEVTTRKLFFL